MRRRPEIANLHYGVVFVALSLYGGHGAQAARLCINRKYPLCSILRRSYLAPLSLSMTDKPLSACKNSFARMNFYRMTNRL